MGRNNCGGRCLLYAHLENGNITKMTTETAADCPAGEIPLTACVRGLNYHKTFLSEDRLQYPMKRTGKRGEGTFVRISWEEAIDTIAAEWIRIRDTYGPASRYVNYATGVTALMRGNQLAKRLLSFDGGYLDYYNSYSSACIRQATEPMYGTCETGTSPEDWLNSNLIILWGHNPAETRFDSSTMYYLKQAKEKGIPIIGIDPRENDTIRQLHAEWIPVRPATDSALCDGMAYVIYTENLHNQDFLDRCCVGFDKAHMPEGIDPAQCYLSYLLGEADGIPKTPAWASAVTGASEAAIISLARRYAGAKPAVLLQGYGAQRNAYGEQSTRGGILLACMTGNVGISGGWASGAGEYITHKNPRVPSPPNPFPGKIPAFLWTQAITDGTRMTDLDGVTGLKKGQALPGNIKMILNLAGNSLINQHSDINRTAQILQDPSLCEFIVCSDLFLTASARFADILLPGTSMFESENIAMPWFNTDFIGFHNQMIEPLYECRFEYDWLSDVAERLGLKEEFTEGRTNSGWLRFCYEELKKTETELPDYEELRKRGIYRYKKMPLRIAFEKESKNPEIYPFPTASGKIEILSKKVYETEYRDFFPAIPRYVPPQEGPDDPLAKKFPLQLMGWHTKRRCHSIHDNNKAMHAIDPQMLWMNPADAAVRNIEDGEEVLVFNDRGQMQIPVRISSRLMQGVTALSQGAWYAPDSAKTDLGGSINVLTSQQPTPYARGNPQHTNLVEVRKM